MKRFFHRLRVLLIGAVLLLFSGLTFNAYACLVPVFGVIEMTGMNDCSTPQDQSARQFCETFKTLAFNGLSADPSSISHIESVDLPSLSLLAPLRSRDIRYGDLADSPPSQDFLLKTTVLRI